MLQQEARPDKPFRSRRERMVIPGGSIHKLQGDNAPAHDRFFSCEPDFNSAGMHATNKERDCWAPEGSQSNPASDRECTAEFLQQNPGLQPSRLRHCPLSKPTPWATSWNRMPGRQPCILQTQG